MRAGLAITQVETIRDRADDHRDRKCRETEDTRDGDFKIRLWIMTVRIFLKAMICLNSPYHFKAGSRGLT